MSKLIQESDDVSPLRFKRITNSSETSISLCFSIVDEPSDDEDDKGKQVLQEDKQVVDQSLDHEHHLDDFPDDVGLHNEQVISQSKKSVYSLIDEDIDEDLYNKNSNSSPGVWTNINDLPYASPDVPYYNKYIDEEAEEELQDSDIHSVPSLSDEDHLDNFIDDESEDIHATDDESTDEDI